MFSKYFSNSSAAAAASEVTPMLAGRAIQTNLTTIAVPASTQEFSQAAQEVVQHTAQKLQRLNESAPYSFRVLGLIGGVAMILSNTILLPGRILTLHWTDAILSLYSLLFGLVVVILELEAPQQPPSSSQTTTAQAYAALQQGIRTYFRFLEFTWGKGAIYLFFGSLQAAKSNVVDVCVGSFVMVVGMIACAASVQTAHALRRFRMTIESERDLKRKFDKYAHHKAHLTLAELQLWMKDAGFVLSSNESVSAYLALNKNFNDQLSYEEMVEWWSRPQRGNLGLEQYTV